VPPETPRKFSLCLTICINVVFYSEFSNRNINKSHVKITSCYFLAVEIAYIQVLGRQKIWHRTMQLAS